MLDLDWNLTLHHFPCRILLAFPVDFVLRNVKYQMESGGGAVYMEISEGKLYIEQKRKLHYSKRT